MKIIKSWNEIKLTDFTLDQFELDVPLTLVKNKNIKRNEKHAVILAYSILNHLDRFSKIVTEKDLDSISKYGVYEIAIPKEVYRDDSVLNKAFLMKFLTKLGVSPRSRYTIIESLINSDFVTGYNEETGNIYLKSKKDYYFSDGSDRVRHTFRIIVKDINEIKLFAKPRYIGAFLVRFLYNEPYVTKKNNREIKPYTYQQICDILDVTTQSIRTALKISKEFRLYKFIEVSSSDYYMNKYFSDNIDGTPSGFFTRIKVFDKEYINEETKKLIIGPKYFKNKEQVESIKKYRYRYFKLEGMRLLCNYEIRSARLNKRNVKMKSNKKYVKKKGFKLKLYDGIGAMRNKDYRWQDPHIFKVTSESTYNSLYAQYNDDNDAKTLSVNIFAMNLKEAVRKLKLFAKLSATKKLINVVNKFNKFMKKGYIDLRKYSINFYRKVIRKEKTEITFNTSKDGIMSAVKKSLNIINEFFENNLLVMSSLFDVSKTLNSDFSNIKGTTIKSKV